MMKVFKEFRLYCAHKVAAFGPSHKCSRLHGHTLKVKVTLEHKCGSDGVTVPFERIQEEWDKRCAFLDHTLLNDHFGDNPTTEKVALFILGQMKEAFRLPTSVEVKETESSGVIAND